MRTEPGIVMVLLGPSQVGKGTICKMLKEELGDQFASPISVTTRPKRSGEEDGRDYHFRTLEEFQEMKNKGRFFETAEIHGNWYGTLESELFERFHEGRDLIFDVNCEGYVSLTQTIDELFRRSIYGFFIKPCSDEELLKRLEKFPPEERERRWQTAKKEFKWLDRYLCIQKQQDDAPPFPGRMVRDLQVIVNRSNQQERAVMEIIEYIQPALLQKIGAQYAV